MYYIRDSETSVQVEKELIATTVPVSYSVTISLACASKTASVQTWKNIQVHWCEWLLKNMNIGLRNKLQLVKALVWIPNGLEKNTTKYQRRRKS